MRARAMALVLMALSGCGQEEETKEDGAPEPPPIDECGLGMWAGMEMAQAIQLSPHRDALRDACKEIARDLGTLASASSPGAQLIEWCEDAGFGISGVAALGGVSTSAEPPACSPDAAVEAACLEKWACDGEPDCVETCAALGVIGTTCSAPVVMVTSTSEAFDTTIAAHAPVILSVAGVADAHSQVFLDLVPDAADLEAVDACVRLIPDVISAFSQAAQLQETLHAALNSARVPLGI